MRSLTILIFFFNDTATTEIYTLSLHDALPICLAHTPVDHDQLAVRKERPLALFHLHRRMPIDDMAMLRVGDRKSTRLNSSHANTSYAAFCLKKNNLHVCLLLLSHIYLTPTHLS